MAGFGPAAPLPPSPEEQAALAMLAAGGGGAPGLPPAPAPDPMMAAGAPLPAGPIPGLPSTDPNTIAALQQQDLAMVQQAQAAAAQEASAMTTAAGVMGGAPPMGSPPAAGVGPLPGDPSMMGGPVDPMAGLPPELAAAFGGAGMGGLEDGSVAPMPGEEFAGDLGGF